MAAPRRDQLSTLTSDAGVGQRRDVSLAGARVERTRIGRMEVE